MRSELYEIRQIIEKDILLMETTVGQKLPQATSLTMLTR